MTNRIAAIVLFSFLLTTASAQEPDAKPPVLTGFAPLTEKELQEGVIRLFDGVTTFGWHDHDIIDGKIQIRPLQPDEVHKTGIVPSPVLYFLSTKIIDKPFRFDRWTADDSKFQPKNLEPIFDGKTLTGWKIHGKAEAEVVDGAIRLTNGSGSIESEGKYGDFVLQFEYRTDKPVNSGCFFRCIPGEMMNGYECQIFNNPPEGDYKKYIGTDTGGLFRRQIGRNVGAKDGVWNYITIAAGKDRMATWVNGIQVTDFKDDRKPDANPRKGLRTEAGTIQFQGHDASTEIFLRNIRIREL